jgi:hypothetical protein
MLKDIGADSRTVLKGLDRGTAEAYLVKISQRRFPLDHSCSRILRMASTDSGVPRESGRHTAE